MDNMASSIDIPAPQNVMILDNFCNSINTLSSFCRNKQGHVYCCGKRFSETDWANFVQTYSDLLNDNNGKCTVCQLAATARVRVALASKVIRLQ